tara:strand:+ start:25220 stop:26389 length:1170 start_codon:yes stop_codon:yes gene_type:complete
MKNLSSEALTGNNSSSIKQLSEFDHEIFDLLVKNSFDMIVLMNANGEQTFVSASCEGILGFKPSELINIAVIDEKIHPEDQLTVNKAFLDIIDKGSHGGTQYRHIHKDGHWVYLEAFGNNLLEDPLIESVVLNVRDVTERKQTEKKLIENEDRLKELNATKDRFISIIGHDLKTPFNAIMGFSELLLDDIRNNEYTDIEEYAQLISESSHRVNDLLTNLLTWSRTQTGRISFKPKEIEIDTILQNVKALLNESALNKSIEINLPHNCNHKVNADVDMVHAIVRNLVSNGIKFTPEGGVISIHITSDKDYMQIAISDNGIGINEERLANLFCIESTKSTPGTNGEKGTGFGLLLTKEFVDMHNGVIWAEQNKGNGTTFKFTLPSSKCPSD